MAPLARHTKSRMPLAHSPALAFRRSTRREMRRKTSIKEKVRRSNFRKFVLCVLITVREHFAIAFNLAIIIMRKESL